MPSPRLSSSPPCAQACRKGPLARPGSVGDLRGRLAGISVRVLDVHPLDAMNVPDRRRPQVRVRPAGDARRLQPAARFVASRATARVFRAIAVEAGVVGLVFREVRDAGRRIDRDRLVQHPTHADDRLAGRRRGIGAHLEDIAVLAPAARREVDDRFLAGEPGAPGRRAARAVVDRPAERWLCARPTPAAESERRRAARRRERLAGRGHRVIACGRQDRTRERPLVVANQGDFRLAVDAPRGDDAHAVVGARRRGAVRHGVAGPGVGAVLEAFRQENQRQAGLEVCDRPERAVRTQDEARFTGRGGGAARVQGGERRHQRRRARKKPSATDARRHPRILIALRDVPV